MSNRKLKNDRFMTYEQTAFDIWKEEGMVGNPLSKQAIQKIEKRAIRKVKNGLKKVGYTLEDIAALFEEMGKTVEHEVLHP